MMSLDPQSLNLGRLPVELQQLIGSYLEQESLFDLIQCCHSLYGSLNSVLYRQMDLRSAPYSFRGHHRGNLFKGLKALSALDPKDKACWLQHLIITVPNLYGVPRMDPIGNQGSTTANFVRNRDQYNTLLQDALNCCSALEALTYAVPNTTQRSIDAMKRLPKLTEFSYTLLDVPHPDWPDNEWTYNEEDEITDNEMNFYFRPISLVGFQNLTLLHIYRLRQCLSSIQRDIISILVASPHLSDLALSIEPHGLFNLPPHVSCESRHTSTEERYHGDFWENICRGYTSLASGHLLRLNSLHLGTGIYLEKPFSPSFDNYLVRAFDLSALHMFRYDNVVNEANEYLRAAALDTAWAYFDETVKALENLHVAVFTSGLLTFINSPHRRTMLKRLTEMPAPLDYRPPEYYTMLEDVLGSEAMESVDVVVYGDSSEAFGQVSDPDYEFYYWPSKAKARTRGAWVYKVDPQR